VKQVQQDIRFSPLFIGELSSTSPVAPLALVPSKFQSPLHRGTLFNFLRPMGRGLCLRFSPLFIGELSSTGSGARGPDHTSSFQSPLHRGTLFNPGERRLVFGHFHVSVPSSSGNSLQLLHGSRPPPPLFVSVPSSSGNSLQRRASAHSLSAPVRFSPLFIGELSSTSSLELPNRVFRGFSPLFIGELSSTKAKSCGLLQTEGFSPLFIGELSSTVSPPEATER